MNQLVKHITKLVLLVLMLGPVMAQNTNHKNITRNIEVSRLSETTIIDFEITKEVSSFMLSVSCNIIYGEMAVEIHAPNGELQGNFAVKSILSYSDIEDKKPTDKNYISEAVSGQLNKTFNAPQTGIWEIKIIPRQARGHITISNDQNLF
ncbi:hypothetical protein [Winogradskyella sp.]|uniref:hypothetical protein n=1 Tax=Winogradskyella sp. TaxID=1883156 RepID=UPI0026201B97|nr:hypothetical protein [Winogradskyella sp.]